MEATGDGDSRHPATLRSEPVKPRQTKPLRVRISDDST
jgi:hypothetical protein